MGKSGSGKTSMRSIIFANYIARDTRRLGATIGKMKNSKKFFWFLSENAFFSYLFSSHIIKSLCARKILNVNKRNFWEDRVFFFVYNFKTHPWAVASYTDFLCILDVEHSHVRFLGNLVLNLWDCGGQESYMDQYFQSQKENIFRNVEVLIYVFDVESREFDKDMHYYQSCLEAILNFSPEAKIFCLIHKMDLVQEDQRDSIFRTRQEDLKKLSLPLECTAFRTSIWDETLYRAWSSIVYQLIPNVKSLENSLHQFATILDADEVLLFERATFLVISHCQLKHHSDSHRFEKVSNIIKQFKLSCAKLGAKFQSMEVRNSQFAAFIDTFTSNTMVLVVQCDSQMPSEATLVNIRNARKFFEELENPENSFTKGNNSISSYQSVNNYNWKLTTKLPTNYQESIMNWV